MKLRKILMGFVLQNGLSPLHIASQEGHGDIVKTLIKAGASIDQADQVSTHIPTRVQYDIRACDQCIFNFFCTN